MFTTDDWEWFILYHRYKWWWLGDGLWHCFTHISWNFLGKMMNLTMRKDDLRRMTWVDIQNGDSSSVMFKQYDWCLCLKMGQQKHIAIQKLGIMMLKTGGYRGSRVAYVQTWPHFLNARMVKGPCSVHEIFPNFQWFHGRDETFQFCWVIM